MVIVFLKALTFKSTVEHLLAGCVDFPAHFNRNSLFQLLCLHYNIPLPCCILSRFWSQETCFCFAQ
ncbi:hypothetical protein X975_25898, partial [Stegodyphus mimosarum]